MPLPLSRRFVSIQHPALSIPRRYRALIPVLIAILLGLSVTPLRAQLGAQPASTNDLASYFEVTFGLDLGDIRWGEFHAHTTYSADAAACDDAVWPDALSPWDAYLQARDVEGLDFVALNDHAEMPNPAALPQAHRRAGLDNWQSLMVINQQYNSANPARPFIVFAGWEYTNTYGYKPIESGYGHKNVVFRDIDPVLLPDQRYGASPLLDDAYAPDAQTLWSRLDRYRPPADWLAGRAITIIHTPAKVGSGDDDVDLQDHRTDWDTMDADFVRHVEIDSKWECSEGPPPPDRGCAPDPSYHYESDPEADPLTIRTVLYERWVIEGDQRFLLGFVGGTDSHAGGPANSATGQCLMPYRGSLTGVVARQVQRGALWRNVWQRHTLACSTGVRLPVLLAVETAESALLMGEQGPHDGEVRVRVLADPQVEAIDIIVDGCVALTIDSSIVDETLQVDAGRHYLYARGRLSAGAQEELRVWTSPVYLGEAAF